MLVSFFMLNNEESKIWIFPLRTSYSSISSSEIFNDCVRRSRSVFKLRISFSMDFEFPCSLRVFSISVFSSNDVNKSRISLSNSFFISFNLFSNVLYLSAISWSCRRIPCIMSSISVFSSCSSLNRFKYVCGT